MVRIQIKEGRVESLDMDLGNRDAGQVGPAIIMAAAGKRLDAWLEQP